MKRLPFWPIAWTLAVFTTLVFVLDVFAGVLFPNWYVMQKFWELILPGYTFISWGSFLTGLVESFLGGFLTAVLFVPIYNTVAVRERAEDAAAMRPVSQHHA